MLACSAGGNHCAYVFGMMEQLFLENPDDCKWKDLAGISAGALICAGVAQTSNNTEYIHTVDSLYRTMCKKRMVKEWSFLGSFFNTIHSFLFKSSLYQDTLTSLVASHFDSNKFNLAGKNLHIGVYNKSKGEYRTMSGNNDLMEYLCASASVPGVFPARNISGDMYVDGAIRHIIPVVEIMEWCDQNAGMDKNLDIMLCYPIVSYEQFKKTEYDTSRFKIINVVTDTVINMLWNNMVSDVQCLNDYFQTDIRTNNIFTCKSGRVRVFAPDVGYYASFTSINSVQLQKMFEHGKHIVKNMYNTPHNKLLY